MKVFRTVRQLAIAVCLASLLFGASACLDSGNTNRPRTLAEISSENLAFRLETDIVENNIPVDLRAKETPTETFNENVKKDFDARRIDENLLRTVASPDNSHVLALYETAETLVGEFRIDLYNADGVLQRALLPRELSGGFPQKVAWSSDGNFIAFIALRSSQAKATPTPEIELPPDTNIDANNGAPPISASPVAPVVPTVPAFTTEQIYVCDREGYTLRPVTVRDGLIYFHFAWSPDSRALVALACKEDEWNESFDKNLLPSGRARIVLLNGGERLLDDRRTNVLPVWSPDAAKVATAFDTDVAIYDASIASPVAPTAATINITDKLRAASIAYDTQRVNQNPAPQSNSQIPTNAQTPNINSPNTAPTSSNADGAINTSGDGEPLSFNPIVRLAWLEPQILLVETGFVRRYAGDIEKRDYLRWHVLNLSPQARALNL